MRRCGGATRRRSADIGEHGSIDFGEAQGDILAAGGSEDVLYVGEVHRVQEFKEGVWKGEIPLTGIASGPESKVEALALDQQTSSLYLVYNPEETGVADNIVRPFNAEGKALATIEVPPRVEGSKVYIEGLAVDSEGHLAVTALEEAGSGTPVPVRRAV